MQMCKKSDVSQQRHNAAYDSHKQIFLLSVQCEKILPQDRNLSWRETCFLQSAFTSLATTRQNQTVVWNLRSRVSFRSNQHEKILVGYTWVMKCRFSATSRDLFL